MDKLDLKKKHKDLYKMKEGTIRKVEVPKQTVISIKGQGDPNTSTFGDSIATIYPLAYTIKFIAKSKEMDFVVMPPEAFWWSEDMNDFVENKKDKWQWEVFVVLPDYISMEDFEKAKAEAAKKKELPLLNDVEYKVLEEETAFQLLHIGSYSNERANIQKLHRYIKEEGFEFDGKVNKHHEIYLSDARKVEESKLKTIIRQSAVPKKN